MLFGLFHLTVGCISEDVRGCLCRGLAYSGLYSRKRSEGVLADGLLTAGFISEDVRGVPCAGGTKREREGETSDFRRQSDAPSLSLLDIPTLPFVPRLDALRAEILGG